jgi:hypothetical protein
MKNTLAMNPEITVVLEYAPSAMRDLRFTPADLIEFLSDCGLGAYLVGPQGRLTPGVPGSIRDLDYVNLLFSRRATASG